MSASSPSQREFLALALPNMVAGMAVPITQLVDLAYLGHLESVIPLSGVVLATVIFDYIFWCFAFLRVGTTGLVAQAVGRDDVAEQDAMFWRTVLLGLAIGLLLISLQSAIASVGFSLLSGEDVVEQAGRTFFSTHIWGALPLMVNMAIIGWLLGLGRSGVSLVLHLLWQLCNIILNYFFIIKFDWGAWGAGLGTALSEWFSLLTSLVAVWFCRGGIPAFDADKIFHWPPLKQLLTLNSAIMLRTFLLMSVLGAFTNVSALFGTLLLAANALLMKMFMFFAFVIDGFAIALETFAGNSHGLTDKTRLKRALILSLQWAIISSFLFIFLYLFAGSTLLGFLTIHTEVIDAALPYIPYLCGVIALGGIAFVFDGLFYGLAKPKLLVLSMLCAVSAFAPLAYLAAQESSAEWLWYAFIAFIAVRMATLIRPVLQAVR